MPGPPESAHGHRDPRDARRGDGRHAGMNEGVDDKAAQRFSTRAAFFIAGFGMAAWAPLVPFAKARSGLDDGGLGLLLLGLGAGSIVAMPVAGALAARVGCRRVIAVATVTIALTLP